MRKKLVLGDDGIFENANEIQCPVCGDLYVHLGTPYVTNGADDYKAWEGRGDLVTVQANCESGHSFDICFGHHKGNTFCYMQYFTDVLDSAVLEAK